MKDQNLSCRTCRLTSVTLITFAMFSCAAAAEDGARLPVQTRPDISFNITDDEAEAELLWLVQDAQPAPLAPVPESLTAPGTSPVAADQLTASLFGSADMQRSLLSQARQVMARGATSDIVLGGESRFRAATDAGSLLGRSNSAKGLFTHSRAPVITDPRVRGSHVGSLIASGSYWFPARQDLDTILSKIDSRNIDNILVTRGPFAARYGPGFDFIDVELLQAPRYDDGFQSYGSSSLEYKTNGEQFYGRQAVWGGDTDYGFYLSYGHRTGNDYRAGDGSDFIASYKSADWLLALGYDLSEYRHLDFSYLRLDQSDVEVVTQLLDIDFLVTDGFELTYAMEDHPWFDEVVVEGWYNQTRLRGNANSAGKRAQVPFLTFVPSVNTFSHNMSTGFSSHGTWGDSDIKQTTLGADLRYLRQEVTQLYEVVFLSPPGIGGNNETPEVNGPLPDAYSANPGLFVEQTRRVNDRLVLNLGGRVDQVEMNAATTANEVGGLGGPTSPFGPGGAFPFTYNPDGDPIVFPDGMGGLTTFPGFPVELDDLLLGSFNRSFTLGSAYLTSEYELNPCWTATSGLAFAMRPPTMSEMYPLQTIATVLPQQTFSVLFGNPNLKPPKRYEVDLGLTTDSGYIRGSINGFFALVEDYITYDALDPAFYLYQRGNTDLASLAGFEFYGEADLTCQLTAFANVNYVSARDLTRDTNPLPAVQDLPALGGPGFPTRSGIIGRPGEPLPGISPLESRVGLRWHEASDEPTWAIELTARIVDNQDRFAASLQELPTPGFTTLALRGYWQATRSLNLIAGIENLTDNFYQEHLDPHGRLVEPFPGAGNFTSLGTVYQPGFNFYSSVEMTY